MRFSRPVILASSSPHRRELLNRFGLKFEAFAPDIDESALKGESASDYVKRLALAKAQAIATRFPHAIVIGSDQAAVIDAAVLGKPGGKERAVAQLRQASGRTVRFFTGLAVLDSSGKPIGVDVVPYSVHFRELTSEEIDRYVEADRPYDCAGSFKAEGLGITLFRAMEGEDPTALIGLPLIRLAELLRLAGIPLP